MRRRLVLVSVLAIAGFAAVCISFAASGGFHHGQAVSSVAADDGSALMCTAADASAAGSCLTKHCPANTHCCIGCTSNPVCVRNGVPCPECAPQ